ncbi:AraC family transcriptional regulator [Paenibacillus pectinilyticus]|uniref:AraC family transcriptional regulator n=1 Tax=Paenibacillus pectinilyticus TaxID=512399 RepID=A0A1C0ZY00_9BACL|nr:response regulator [Paenibacillus pectinilyticus]OCT13006.1 AraC family transcriptional regulator [Paenibacillus pectinilyticus]
MFKLVIVDDEPTVRYGLSQYFDWKAYGIEVVGEADDGDVGLEVIEREKPDIVLTDVRMPNMDGIQMSNQLSEQFPHIKIVFVSGHDDAEYLKSALKVKAVDYMFKPVNLGELTIVIERLVDILHAERQERKLIEDMQVKLIESMPLLREKFLMSLIREGIMYPSRVQDRINFLGLTLPLEGAYWVIAIRIDDATEIAQTRSERDQQLLSYSVLNIVQELIERHIGGYVFENQIGEFVGILRMTEEEDQENLLFTLAQEVRESLHSYLKISVTIGVGERISRLASLPQSYTQAKEAADQRWFLGKNQIISMDNLEQDQESVYRFDVSQQERMVSSLKSADSEKVREELREVYSGLSRNRTNGIAYGRNISLQLLLLASRILLELHVSKQDLEAKENELMASVFQQETLRDLRGLVESHLLEVCERIGEKRNGKSKNVIERTRAIIDTRFAENLQVGDIATEVFLSTTYLCLLFKQETGETINEYMTKARVNQAKMLLKDPANKFYDVCYAVGYSDPSYFSKIFKKYTGYTPSSYREQVM